MAFIERGELRLAYERNGEGRPLVLVSPLGWSGRHWHEFQVPYFAEHFDVITYDHRGTGRSSALGSSLSTRSLAADLGVLLEELDLLDGAFVLGHSSGGGVVQWLAIEEPDSVRAAVLAASGPGRFDDRPVVRGFPSEMVAALTELGWPGWLEAHLASAELFVSPEPGLVERLRSALEAEAATELRSFLRHLLAGFAHETTERLAEIEMPCFVVVGDRDEVALEGSPTRIESSLELAKRLFYAEYVEIEEAALALHFERPEAFNEAVLDFLVRH